MFAHGFPFFFIEEFFMHDCSQPTAAGIYAFDARGIAKRFRHAAIFGALDALNPGEVMRFCNDHDPIPLLHQIDQHFGEHVRISYVSRNPGEIIIDFLIAS